jgi:hypothetical protein
LLRSGIVSAKIMCVMSAFYRCCARLSLRRFGLLPEISQ